MVPEEWKSNQLEYQLRNTSDDSEYLFGYALKGSVHLAEIWSSSLSELNEFTGARNWFRSMTDTRQRAIHARGWIIEATGRTRGDAMRNPLPEWRLSTDD